MSKKVHNSKTDQIVLSSGLCPRHIQKNGSDQSAQISNAVDNSLAHVMSCGLDAECLDDDKIQRFGDIRKSFALSGHTPPFCGAVSGMCR